MADRDRVEGGPAYVLTITVGINEAHEPHDVGARLMAAVSGDEGVDFADGNLEQLIPGEEC